MTPKFEDAVAIIVKAWEGRKDAPDYPDYDDINTAIGSLEKAVKALDTVKRHAILLEEPNTERVEIAPIYKYDEARDYEIIKEWLEENE